MIDFISVEHRSSDIDIVLSSTLKDVQYTIVDVMKYRRNSLVRLRQADSKLFWVDMYELKANARCMLLHQNHTVFSNDGKMVRGSLEDFSTETMIFTESPEPILMVSSLVVGPLFSPECTEKEYLEILVVCGPPSVGKSTLIDMLERDYPGKVKKCLRSTSRHPGRTESERLGFVFKDNSDLECTLETNNVVCHYELYGDHIWITDEDIFVARSEEKLVLLEMDPCGMDSLKASGHKFNCVYLDGNIESLDNKMRDQGMRDEQKIQNRLRQAEKDRYYALESDIFTHIIADGDLMGCYARLKEISALYWPRTKSAVEGHLLIEEYDWPPNTDGRTVKRICTMSANATTIELPKGIHTLYVHTDQEIPHAATFWSHTPFRIGSRKAVLHENKSLNFHQFEGRYSKMDMGSWNVLFRYSFDSPPNGCLLEAQVSLNDERMQRWASRLGVSNFN